MQVLHSFHRRLALLGTAVLLLGSAAGHAQDAAVVNSRTVAVKVDNAQLRVLEAVLPPGAQGAYDALGGERRDDDDSTHPR